MVGSDKDLALVYRNNSENVSNSTASPVVHCSRPARRPCYIIVCSREVSSNSMRKTSKHAKRIMESIIASSWTWEQIFRKVYHDM